MRLPKGNLGVEFDGPLQHIAAFKRRCILADDYEGDGFGFKGIDTFAR
jgi:hypothetical protein